MGRVEVRQGVQADPGVEQVVHDGAHAGDRPGERVREVAPVGAQEIGPVGAVGVGAPQGGEDVAVRPGRRS